jgi:hypothetical protein
VATHSKQSVIKGYVVISPIHTFVNIPALLLKTHTTFPNQGRDINKGVNRGYRILSFITPRHNCDIIKDSGLTKTKFPRIYYTRYHQNKSYINSKHIFLSEFFIKLKENDTK